MLLYGFIAVAAYLIGVYSHRILTKKHMITIKDTYEAPEKPQTTTQFLNACIVKLTDEIRKTGALRVKQLEPGKHQITLRVVK